MRPPVFGEAGRDARNVIGPDREVEVVVVARDRAGMEVDGPPAEEPVLGADGIESTRGVAERGELFGGVVRP